MRGEVVSPEVCLGCARSQHQRACNYPAFLIEKIIEEEGNVRDRISPTTMHACRRKIALKRKYDYSIDPEKYWPMVRGTAIHEFVEHLPPLAGHVREEKLQVTVFVDMKPYALEGTPDEYIPDEHHLIDYKSVKAIVPALLKPKPEWTAQLSCYRWMLLQIGVRIDTAEIVLIDPTKTVRVPYRLWSLERTEEFIREHVLALVRVYAGEIEPVLPLDEQWKCLACEVREQCEHLADELDEMPPTPEERRRAG